MGAKRLTNFHNLTKSHSVEKKKTTPPATVATEDGDAATKAEEQVDADQSPFKAMISAAKSVAVFEPSVRYGIQSHLS